MSLPLPDWESFYVIAGGAGAGLTGLMFVVVALAADRGAARSPQGISVFSTPTVIHFSSVLVIAALMSVPHQTVLSLQVCLGLGGLAGLGAMAIAGVRMGRFVQYRADRGDWFWHIIVPLGGYATLFVAAFLLDPFQTLALDLIAFVAVALLLVGIHNAWDVAVFLVAIPRTSDREAEATRPAAAPSAVPVEPAPSTAQTDPPRKA